MHLGEVLGVRPDRLCVPRAVAAALRVLAIILVVGAPVVAWFLVVRAVS